MQDEVVTCPVQGVYQSVIASSTVFCENCGTLFLEAGCNNSYSLNLHNSGFNKSKCIAHILTLFLSKCCISNIKLAITQFRRLKISLLVSFVTRESSLFHFI